jgi:hypothetical protein
VVVYIGIGSMALEGKCRELVPAVNRDSGGEICRRAVTFVGDVSNTAHIHMVKRTKERISSKT